MIDWVTSWFKDATGETLFLVVTLFGMFFSIGSLVLGGDGGDHDAGDHGGGDHGGGDHGDHGDHGHGVHGSQAPSIINLGSLMSLRGLSLMATGFGSVGYIVMHYSHKILLSSVSGVVGAFALAIPALMLVGVFMRQQSNSAISSNEFVGKEGSVSLSIPAGGRGEISVFCAGQQYYKVALSADGSAIRTGANVRVVRATPDSLIVSLIS